MKLDESAVPIVSILSDRDNPHTYQAGAERKLRRAQAGSVLHHQGQLDRMYDDLHQQTWRDVMIVLSQAGVVQRVAKADGFRKAADGFGILGDHKLEGIMDEAFRAKMMHYDLRDEFQRTQFLNSLITLYERIDHAKGAEDNSRIVSFIAEKLSIAVMGKSDLLDPATFQKVFAEVLTAVQSFYPETCIPPLRGRIGNWIADAIHMVRMQLETRSTTSVSIIRET